jgi:hypothetical protein
MDKGLVIVTIVCIAMLAFFVGYQLSIGGSPNDRPTADADDWDSSIIVDLTLKGDSIEVSESEPVAIEGSRVTILFGGTYKITGSLSDGQIAVYTDDEDPVRLILNGVNINCSTSAPISIMDAEEACIILADGTENFVGDTATYVYGDPSEDEPNAVVFCKSDLTIMGNGVLNVVGNYNDGIASKDGLVIQSGTVNVRSVDDGIRGRDYIVVKSGVLDLEVGGDGLKSDNPENATLGNISVENGTINIVSGGDAFQAEKKVLITGGSFNLKSGGGSSSVVAGNVSTKGIKGLVSVTIDGGVFEIDSADDALHSNGTITVNRGSFTLSAGDDAIQADNFVEVNGGNINIAKSFEGIESATVTINDGDIHITSSDDGIDAVSNVQNPNSGDVSIVNGAIDITSGTDAIQAERNVVIADGDFAFTTGGGSNNTVAADASAKGVKGVASVVIDGGTYTISSADDALHSNGGITLNAGTLVLSSGDDAIHADGSVEINGGDIKVARSVEGIEGAVITINGGDISIVSSDDGIDAVVSAGTSNTGVMSVVNGVIDVRSGGDAIQAEANVLITGGSFNLVSGGGSLSFIGADFSAKGIKGVASVTINSGTFLIDSADDTIHSNGNVMINGGSFTLLTGDDTIHADGSIEVNGGNINVAKSFEGIEGAAVTINDGIISIISSDDGIDAMGSLAIAKGVINIKSGGDAIQADTNVLITGGSFNIISGGGSLGIIGTDDSAKGIKAAVSVTINGGTFVIDCADDTIHSDGKVTITGGSFTLLTGDDIIHGGSSVEVTGGDINVLNSPGDLGEGPWNSSIVVDVALKGNSIEVSASRPAYVSGNKVMIRSAGTYRITGSLNDGQIIVNTKDEGAVKLILNGVHISCSTSAPICVLDADEVVISLETGTENIVADGATYVFASPTADEPNAAVFSRSNMTIMGDGLLRVTGNYNDGIASKDGLIIVSGTIFVSSVDDGIRGKDYLIVKGGSLTLNVDGDGLKSDNALNATLGFVSVENGTINIVSGGDAIQAETNVLISGGNFNLTCGGGSISVVAAGTSAKGIKGVVGVVIDGGVLVINSADDAVHSGGTITVNGGSLVLSTADDGMHADSLISINNGNIEITKSYEGIEAPIVTINDGNIHVVSSDDGVNMGVDSGIIPGPGQTGARLSLYSGSYYLYINGGYLAVNALGDGIDSNGAIVMKGGVVIVDGPSSDMNSALDHVAFNITTGFLVAAGSSGMALPPGDLSTQYSVMLNFQTANQAGTLISVRTSTGTELFTFKPTKRYQSIVFSMPNLSLGSTYDVYIGGSHTGTVKDGLYSGGTYTPGTKYTSFTITSKVTRLGPSGGFFPLPP